MTYFINFSGHPAASIPAGLAPGNLPVGLQIIGQRTADDQVIAASAAFERARPWAQSYAICEGRSLSG
jgi:amidase